MDTKFSVALHALVLISESEKPMTSDKIAESVGTNASYIRKITTLLKNAHLIESHRGIRGFRLCMPAWNITLDMVYRAVNGGEGVHLFDIHGNPNDRCIVGKHIGAVLTEEFTAVEKAASRALEQKTLQMLIDDIKNKV
ncbi:MAG: Rrf2 family transcriptional regulator [Clostridia bacterium]|nr:Rrf2 family transcriptional regulator [Clostridia bacterium]